MDKCKKKVIWTITNQIKYCNKNVGVSIVKVVL